MPKPLADEVIDIIKSHDAPGVHTTTIADELTTDCQHDARELTRVLIHLYNRGQIHGELTPNGCMVWWITD